MSNSRYMLDSAQSGAIRGSARLLNAGSARYEGDWPSIPHAHAYAELFYITGGDGQFRIEEKLFPVQVDQLVIVNPNVIHTEVSFESHPLEYIVLGIAGLELAEEDGGDSRFRVLDFRGDSDISTCLRQILRESRQMQEGYETVCQAYMEILIVRLMRSATFALAAGSVEKRASRQCATVRRYIDAHYKEQLTLELLAQQAHVNKYYMSHAFKREYGVSPIQYLIRRRIEESRYLLRETDLSLAQICRMLGFSSGSYFSQSFCKAVGMAPMEYRKRCREQADAPQT